MSKCTLQQISLMKNLLCDNGGRCKNCDQQLSWTRIDNGQLILEECSNCLRIIQNLLNEPDEKTLFPCTHCSKTFRTRGRLNEHVVIHYSVRKFECNQCVKKFKTKKNLRDHVRYVHSVARFTCDLCERAFKVKSKLYYHKMSMHNNTIFTSVMLPSSEQSTV